ncbi:angiotensin-converting enzyme isoform X2 [Toxorhynchites rutilus septentrionalis]|uniref:angiotensin-converting enzyme isoform X2 n=1 Tax=Toxorhynchites rutilus septentrionalis TaxID=329112 RepID=UPI00247A57A2|nr:angiotensin-converting enzyme isoform X2 [Toxorhynchites rutilus septentrionalis]
MLPSPWNLLSAALGVLIISQVILAEAGPQLNLPHLGLVDGRAQILPNSYTESREQDEAEEKEDNSYDRNRSERFGPPYGGLDDDDENYPQGRSNDDRLDRQNRPFSYDDRTRYNNDDNRGFDRDRDLNDRNRNRYTSDVENPNLYQNRAPYNPNPDDRFNPNRNLGDPRDPNRRPYQNDVDNPNLYQNRNPYEPDQNNRFDPNRRPIDGFNPDRPQDPYGQGPFRSAEEERRFRVEMEKLRSILADIDRKSTLECSLNVGAQWNFETNVNEASQVDAIAAQQRYNDFQRLLWDQMQRIDQSKIFDEKLYRQVRLMSIIGPSALPPDQLDRYNRIVNDMLTIFNGAQICAYERPFECGLRLQPHLKDIMAKSRDWDELQYTWLEWRRKSGRNMRELFEQLVDLTNDAARVNNFTNAAAYWQFPYESRNFREEMEQVWNEILPLYEMIHAYVRRKLRDFYGPDKINNNAPLPDHILGDMYGQSWNNILDIVIPYPGRSFLEVTPEMLKQGYNPLVMFQIAEEFYVSMNMSALPPDFWLTSIFTQPPDRPILCQPSAWDFCTGKDYRIKMCTTVTHKDFITAHHELAHVQYFLNYRNNPKVFRDGANPGFHEAIGDAVTLSVASPRHLQKLGLVQKNVDDTAHDINFLFSLALEKVVFLPFALALENWRYDIFDKKVRKEQYNCHWVLLREQYGGVKPPVLRSELDFDPGAKYHVAANIPYINQTIKEKFRNLWM